MKQSFKEKVIIHEVSLFEKVNDKIKSFAKNIEGSDTTEKIGMVLAAAIVVGLAATALKTYAPTAFDSILAKASGIINGLN